MNKRTAEQRARSLAGLIRYSSMDEYVIQGITEAIRSAVEDRDFEWWKALALNDAVAPTPEAVKQYILDSQGLAVEDATRLERERLAVKFEESLHDAWTGQEVADEIRSQESM